MINFVRFSFIFQPFGTVDRRQKAGNDEQNVPNGWTVKDGAVGGEMSIKINKLILNHGWVNIVYKLINKLYYDILDIIKNSKWWRLTIGWNSLQRWSMMTLYQKAGNDEWGKVGSESKNKE